MAVTPVDTGISDEELFSNATAEPAEADTPQELEQPSDQPRDDQGRFAPKEADTPAEQPAAAEPHTAQDHRPNIPPARLKEEADKRREIESLFKQEQERRERLEREISEIRGRLSASERPKVEATPEPEIDPLVDPQGFVKRIKGDFEQERLSDRREFSLRLAKAVHRDKFDEAYTAAQQAIASGDRQLTAEMNSSSDPGETLMAWHRKSSTLRMVGDDPNAWLEKQLDERMNNPEFQAKFLERIRGQAQQPGARPATAVQLPPSLSNMARGGERQASADDNDTSDEALFNYATRR